MPITINQIDQKNLSLAEQQVTKLLNNYQVLFNSYQANTKDQKQSSQQNYLMSTTLNDKIMDVIQPYIGHNENDFSNKHDIIYLRLMYVRLPRPRASSSTNDAPNNPDTCCYIMPVTIISYHYIVSQLKNELNEQLVTIDQVSEMNYSTRHNTDVIPCLGILSASLFNHKSTINELTNISTHIMMHPYTPIESTMSLIQNELPLLHSNIQNSEPVNRTCYRLIESMILFLI